MAALRRIRTGLLILLSIFVFLFLWERTNWAGSSARDEDSEESAARPKHSGAKHSKRTSSEPAANPLDGCRHVYLDVGTNIGVQIRKVFEPGLYPGSPALPVLANNFPVPRDAVCAHGFEPNPDHKQRLDMLEKRYAAVGLRVKVERAAASDEDGTIGFYLDRDDPGREWGARITPLAFPKTRVEVRQVDFAAWFRRFVLTRRIPAASVPKRANDSRPLLAMKLDIEGHEKAVLGPLLKLGLLCHIDLLVLEGVHLKSSNMAWVPKFFEEQRTKGCETRVVDMDDDRAPLTPPSSTHTRLTYSRHLGHEGYRKDYGKGHSCRWKGVRS